MKTIKFNKTICGVDFLLNVGDYKGVLRQEYTEEVQNTDFFQILFLKNISGTLQLNQSSIDLAPYSIIFISKFQQHQWNINLEDLEANFLVFQEDFLNEFFADQLFSYRLLYFYQSQYPLLLKSDAVFFEKIKEILSEISLELKNPQTDSVHIIRSLLYYLLMQLNRKYAQTYGIETAMSLDNHAYHFRKLLEEHITSKQRIEEYTEMLGLSRITLNKAIKTQFNTTASDLIKQRLLFEVKNLLIYSNLSINQIAEKLNFSEANHLTRLFKKREGITPTEYRLAYQNGR